jgi:glucose dehydrogenase
LRWRCHEPRKSSGWQDETEIPVQNHSGRDTQQRFQPDPGLKVAEVPRLKLKWSMAYPGGRNGAATVGGGRVFLSSSSGSVYSLNSKTGCMYWRFEAESATRSTILIGKLPASMMPHRFAAYFTDNTRFAYAIDAETGASLWKTRVDDQPVGIMTGSPVLADGRLFVPISSYEEVIAQLDRYECCKFRGALAAVDAVSGKLLWKTYTIPTQAKPLRRYAKAPRCMVLRASQSGPRRPSMRNAALSISEPATAIPIPTSIPATPLSRSIKHPARSAGSGN